MKPLHVGLIGFGTVGKGVFDVLRRNEEEIARRAGRPIRITWIATRTLDRARKGTHGVEGVTLTSDTTTVARNSDIDIVCELIGGVEPARTFVLDAIAPLSPWTRHMFGCLAVYVEDKIVLVLRDKRENAADNGVWLATTTEHHESLRREFPNMRSIQVLGKKVTGWQVLPADASDFEEAAMHACELIIARDPRIGKAPGARRTSGSRTKKAIRSFPDDTLAVLRASKGLRIRAGTGRVFVRSWSVKPNGWYRTFLQEPRGSIQVADYEIAVHAKCIRSERLRDEIDRAYLEKYNTAGALKYARDLGRAKSRATTIELVPLPSTN